MLEYSINYSLKYSTGTQDYLSRQLSVIELSGANYKRLSWNIIGKILLDSISYIIIYYSPLTCKENWRLLINACTELG